MNSDTHRRSLQFLLFQRNVFAGLALLLSVALVLMAAFLFTKRERVIISPPVVEQSYWLDSRSVSPTYLEQFGSFLSQLLLSKSASSASAQRHVLLRHTDPSFATALAQKLHTEEQKLTEEAASYVFFPSTIEADPSTFTVKLTGERVFYAKGKRLSAAEESYILYFQYRAGRLVLSGLRAGEELDVA